MNVRKLRGGHRFDVIHDTESSESAEQMIKDVQ